MIVVLSFYEGDYRLAMDLLDWIHELDHSIDTKLLLVTVPTVNMEKLKQSAQRTFSSVVVHYVPQVVTGWPQGPNSMFLEAVKEVNRRRYGPFLWLEPDAVPIYSSWFDEIKEAYRNSGCKFLGSINSRSSDGFKHLSGVAAYPGNAADYWKDLPANIPWDMFNQERIVSMSCDTGLIKNFWGQQNLSPTFKENLEKKDPINTLTLGSIPKRAVLYHRVKDGSLISLLRKKKNEIQ